MKEYRYPKVLLTRKFEQDYFNEQMVRNWTGWYKKHFQGGIKIGDGEYMVALIPL